MRHKRPYVLSTYYFTYVSISSGSKKIEEDRNWGIGKDRTFLSLPTHHFAFPKLYLFLSAQISIVTGNIYHFLSQCLVISIPKTLSFLSPQISIVTVNIYHFLFQCLVISIPKTLSFLSPHLSRVTGNI